MPNYDSLQHIFLIAMPQLSDSFFFQSVVYLWEYNEQGASGVIVNKPLDFRLGEVLGQLAIPSTDPRAITYPVLRGGPVAMDQGFIIRRRHHKPKKQGKPMVEITVSSSKQDLIDMASGEGLGDCLVTLGCAGWEPGQLDRELVNNDWLVAPFNEDILFGILSQDTEGGEGVVNSKWFDAAANVGVDLSRLSTEVGHA
jgi:putative transcriptional regulator